MPAFSPDRDLPRLARLLMGARTAVGHCGYYHLGDLSWNLFLAQLRGEVAENLRLWDDAAGTLRGFAWYYPPDAVDIQVAPWLPDREALETEMLEWALARRLEYLPGEDGPARLSVEAFEEDARFLAVLERLGFRRAADYKLHMVWDLRQPVPEPVLPAGYAVRALSIPADLARRAAVQKAVWPWSRVTPGAYPALLAMPGYDPQLDLVSVAPDGTFAAFAICWLDPVNRAGEFEPVGTHPEHRGKGLGKALVREGLRRLRERGATAALVYPPGGEVAAERLYASAGFRPLQRQFSYAREL
ncbi:MAG TPA: GNAT family N-acetyltransferase [Armatimonadota bacterium]|nr:GNAT family N-acetyltransferase [Armatimonadota bacterium]